MLYRLVALYKVKHLFYYFENIVGELEALAF